MSNTTAKPKSKTVKPKVAKTRQLDNLGDNSRFHIPSLRNTLRNLVLVTANGTSATVSGEKREKAEEPWKSFTTQFANSTQVVDGWTAEDNGADGPAAKAPKGKAVKAPKVKAAKAEKKAPGKPGRKAANVEIKFPKGEFTVADVAKANGVKKFVVRNAIRKLKLAKKAEELKLVDGMKGRKRKLFKLI